MEIIDGVIRDVLDDDIGKNGLFTVPEGVTEIGAWAFESCKSLTRVVISEGVTKIGGGAFYGCENLTSVVIPEGVKSIGDYAFMECINLVSVNIPESVTEIGAQAFEWCESLTSVVIPDGVKKIGAWAFAGCNNLTNITVPKGLTKIGYGAFERCVQLKSKPSNYKAFQIKDGELYCLKKKYKEGVKHFVRGELKLCRRGIHYCTNLFEVFNYYGGELDKDIAIYEIEVGDKVLTSEDSSKCCTNGCRLKKRLSCEEIIKILNGGAE